MNHPAPFPRLRQMPGNARERRELTADFVVHVLGLGLGAVAAVTLLVLAVLRGGPLERLVPAAVYVAGLAAMLGCSAAYHLRRASRWRPWLRRFDHAAIFVMIAGTYTPFTVQLAGTWSVALTAAVWALAAMGVAAKLAASRHVEKLSVALYLGLGWIGIVALDPLLAAIEPAPLILIVAGGVVYSLGVVFHLWRSLPFHNAIWHGFVLAAASVHYVAVLMTVA
jgi:hemolysin III